MIATDLQLNHSVELEVNINGKTTTLLSSIEKISNTNVLLSPIFIGGKLVGFPPEYSVSFIYMEGEGVYCWKNISIKAIQYQGNVYHCVTLLTEAEVWNRRNAFRISVGETMELISFGESGPKTHKVFVKDISETGMAFISNEIGTFFVKHTIRLKLKIFSGQIVQLSAQIVRAQPTKNEGETLYGCRFLEKSHFLSKHLVRLQQAQQQK